MNQKQTTPPSKMRNYTISCRTTPPWHPDAVFNDRRFELPPCIDSDNPDDPRRKALRKVGKDQIQAITALLGVNPALVACCLYTKRPRYRKWRDTTPELNEWYHYEESIGAYFNVGVLLGPVSSHLYTLDFDDPKRLQEFIAANPWVNETLWTMGARGGNIWFILDGFYPKSFDLKGDGATFVECRGEGRMTMIAGYHPTGVLYRVVNRRKPIRIRWEDIRWPFGWPEIPQCARKTTREVPQKISGKSLYDELVEQHGEPFSFSDNGTVNINQVSLAEAFLIEYPLVRHAGGFWHYLREQGIWQEIAAASVRRELGDFMAKCARQLKRPDILTKRTDRLLREIIGHLEGRAKALNRREKTEILVFRNGILDLREPERLLPFSPDYGALNRIEHDFDPSADSPGFHAFLREAISADDAVLIQKWGGMALSGENFAQAILLLEGIAGGGKGTLVDILSRIIGENNIAQLRTRHLESSRFEMARFVGKSLLIGADVPSNFLSLQGASTLKSLTGGDALQIERKGVDGGILLRGNFNVLATSNSRLQVRPDGDEDAWGRRLKIVMFEKRAERQIPELALNIVQDEASGVINWLLEGLKMLKEDYAVHGRWQLTEPQQLRIDGILAESSSVRSFALNELSTQPQKDITSHELYEAYLSFCDRKGWEARVQPIFAQDIAKTIEERFQLRPRHDIPRHGKSLRGYRGVGLARNGDNSAYVSGEF